jgi:hypothetical protein
MTYPRVSSSLAKLIASLFPSLIWPQSRIFRGRRFPRAYGLMWLVLIVQNAIAFAVTGPYSNWPGTETGTRLVLAHKSVRVPVSLPPGPITKSPRG